MVDDGLRLTGAASGRATDGLAAVRAPALTAGCASFESFLKKEKPTTYSPFSDSYDRTGAESQRADRPLRTCLILAPVERVPLGRDTGNK